MNTIIFESGRCSHATCIFCGYGMNERPVNTQLLKARLDRILAENEDDELKIFSSGSFLDYAQFPKEFLDYFAEKMRKKNIKKLTIESRPEFITEETLAPFNGIELTVAIGLESAHADELKTIAKGFTADEYARAADTLHKQGAKVRTYLLCNIPFVEDVKKSIEDSVAFAKKYSDSIVVLNLLAHGKTPLMQLWMQGKWKPLSKKRFHEVVRDIEGIELDEETFHFIPKFPKKQSFVGVGKEFITNPVYDTWQDFIANWYEKPDKDVALFLPCAARKPYKFSKTHTLIWKAIKPLKNVHRIVISSPGVIPFEFNGRYPFDAYDWDERNETPEIMEDYVRINKERIIAYLKNHEYKHYVCYFKQESESYKALKLACEELGIKLTNALPEGEKVTSEKGLAELRKVLSSL